jgi:hypothetical protein
VTGPTQQPVVPAAVSVWTMRRVLLVIGAVLFTVAALTAGGVLTGLNAWAFGFGGFAAWVLSGAVP